MKTKEPAIRSRWCAMGSTSGSLPPDTREHFDNAKDAIEYLAFLYDLTIDQMEVLSNTKTLVFDDGLGHEVTLQVSKSR